jgi:ankyrin repeat protein
MPRRFTSTTNLDNLRKEAKRWLKALRENQTDARERLRRAYPNASEQPVLRDVQHALAREYGMTGWTELKNTLEQSATEGRAQSVGRFLEYACPDHNVRGLPAHRMASHAAMRVLQQNPEVSHDSIYTAVVCGEIEEVERLLREHPQLADRRRPASGQDRSRAGGSYDFLGDLGGKPWTPLLYLCFTRLPLAKANENAVAIARLLLDHGADPNAYFMAGDSRYTPLVGAIGEGEENRPAHTRRDELARLLLERGAEPYDVQVLYNVHFQGKVPWWMNLMYEFSVKAGRKADWDDPAWHMLDPGGGPQWHFRVAVEHNDLELAEWCLAHGARPSGAALYEQAVRLGHIEIAEWLASHGAEQVSLQPTDEEQFIAACLRMDRSEVQRGVARHPAYLRSTRAIFAAAERDRADVVAMLLDQGTPVEVEDEKKQRALHVAAWRNAVNVAKLLIERGAEIDPYELNHSNTPLDFAVWAEHQQMIDLLRPHSRDVWNLVAIGAIERLREIIAADPRLAKISWQTTPLFWLAEDERQAAEIVKLFLAHGADASFRSKKDGSTAAEVARKRGLGEAAELLEAATAMTESRSEYLLREYNQLARDLMNVYDTDDEEALGRLGRHFNRIATFEEVRKRAGRERPTLPQAREFVARGSGFKSWQAFLESIGKGVSQARPTADAYEQAARDFVASYEGDAEALDRLNRHYQRVFTQADVKAEIWRRVYAFRQRSSRVPKNYLQLDESQLIVAQDAGFGNWSALIEAARTGAPPAVPPYEIDAKENRAAPRRRMSSDEWDDLFAEMKERRITGLDTQGLLTDAAMAKLVELEHVTSLSLGGSRELTDDGLLQLARMPQLEHLNLSEYPGGRWTDRGLEVLRSLPNLRRFEMTWQAGITDKGVANLRYCEQLESVDLMGSPTGDGAIEALQGKPRLSRFSTGRLVTNAGLRLLHNFPVMKSGRDGRLLIDGPFTNDGLAGLAGLEGVYDLDLFWHVTGITTDGFAHLKDLTNLMVLGCDGELSDDVALAHLAAIPRLKRLRAQESVATDAGFEALSRSQSLEGFWGRVCPNFGSRGFIAFSKIPTLRSLGIGCANVEDAALSRLPDFPSLRELTPVGFQDEGFRHIGKCRQLERLTCMYCRDTGDAATEQIAGLGIRYYYAGLTKITDRSLEVLGGMQSLEQVEFYECNGVTDAGLVFLARLPQLREVHLDTLPGVTLEGTRVFPAGVRVRYTT